AGVDRSPLGSGGGGLGRRLGGRLRAGGGERIALRIGGSLVRSFHVIGGSLLLVNGVRRICGLCQECLTAINGHRGQKKGGGLRELTHIRLLVLGAVRRLRLGHSWASP